MSTTELPTKNGIYWYQLDAKSRADIVQVDDGNVYYMGDAAPLSLAHHTSGKFLGPISLSDFEQLAALREKIEELRQRERKQLATVIEIRGCDKCDLCEDHHG